MKNPKLEQVKPVELEGQLAAHRQEFADLKLKAATQEFKQWHKIRQLRREIARIKTAIRAQALTGEENHG